MWTKSEKCATVIQHCWRADLSKGTKENFIENLSSCVDLLKWNRELAKLRSDLDALSTKEEILWKQRAKALWLDKGDQNTAFFHAKVNEQRVKKEIKTLRDASVRLCDTRSSGFYGYSKTEAMNEGHTQLYVVEEINLALKQMHPLKSSGHNVPLSHLVRQGDSIGVIQGDLVSRYAPQVSQLLFADDTLLFYQVKPEAMRHIKQILGTFEEASGLKLTSINQHWSLVGTSRPQQRRI
ncbi:UNVERIFIED_CONTAM: hypothetical protein Sradi_3180600 [Sesamum radiatum]|uniref:Reverse transcriptase n=1 Tax=Sesamum radiatum TaxID=300843 RepID=A0AAW2RGN0_SESRA